MTLPRNIGIRSVVKFPARVVGTGGITVAKASGTYTFSLDFSVVGLNNLGPGLALDGTGKLIHDIGSLTADNSLNVTADYMYIRRASDGLLMKVNPTTIAAANTAGVGSLGGVAGTLSLSSGLTMVGTTLTNVWDQAGNDISNNNTGKIGIGTASPSTKLHIVGASADLRVDTTGAAQDPRVSFARTGTVKWSIIHENSASSLNIRDVTNALMRMTFLSDGKVGIGQTVPTTQLHVVVNSCDIRADTVSAATDPRFSLARGGTAMWTLYNENSANSFNIRDITNSAMRVTVLPSGNIGINNTTPGSVLHIKSDSAEVQADTVSAGDPRYTLARAGTKYWSVYNEAGANAFHVRDVVNALFRFSILPNGNVGIGQTTPTSLLHLVKDSADLRIDTVGAGTDTTLTFATAATRKWSLYHEATGNSLNFRDWVAGAFRLTVKSTGIVQMPVYGAGTATFDASGNISSVSLRSEKIDLGPFTRGLADLRRVEAAHLYRWKSEADEHPDAVNAGFFADEVARGIPEAIGPTGGFNRDGMIAALMNAVLELDDRTREAKQ